MSLQEAQVYEAKVRALIETRLCKRKLRFSEKSLEKEEIFKSYDEILDLLKTCARSAIPSLRHLATSCILFFVRAVSQMRVDSLAEHISSLIAELLVEFFSKKSSKVSAKLFDEIILRYQDFAVDSMSESLISGMVQGKTLFLKVEAFRFFSSMLKKRKTVDPSGIRRLLGCLGPAVDAISFGLFSAEDDMNGKALKPKQVEVIIACAKEISHFMLEFKEVQDCSTIATNLHDIMMKFGKTPYKHSLKNSAESTAMNLEMLFNRSDGHSKKRKANKDAGVIGGKDSIKRKSKLAEN